MTNLEKVLITGANGYVGLQLLKQLSSTYDVIGVDKYSDRSEILRKDLFSEDFSSISLDTKIVVHCMVDIDKDYSLKEIYDRNFLILTKLIDWAKNAKVEHFILVSSTMVFNPKERHTFLYDDSKTNSTDAYGKVRAAMEEELLQNENSFRVSIIRPHIIIGNERMGILDIILEKLNKNHLIFLPNSVRYYQQVIHVEDLSNVIFNIILSKKSYVMNIAYTPDNCILHYIKLFKVKLGSSSRLVVLPEAITYLITFISDNINLNLFGPNRLLFHSKPFIFQSETFKNEFQKDTIFNEVDAWMQCLDYKIRTMTK